MEQPNLFRSGNSKIPHSSVAIELSGEAQNLAQQNGLLHTKSYERNFVKALPLTGVEIYVNLANVLYIKDDSDEQCTILFNSPNVPSLPVKSSAKSLFLKSINMSE